MEAIKLTWYQIFFNSYFGYRKDYQASFWYYINQYLKRYVIDFYYYSDGVKEPYSKRVQKKGPRGGHTGNYHYVTIPVSKPTYQSLQITFIPSTWFSFYISFQSHTAIFASYEFCFGIKKLKWNIQIKLNNN